MVSRESTLTRPGFVSALVKWWQHAQYLIFFTCQMKIIVPASLAAEIIQWDNKFKIILADSGIY